MSALKSDCRKFSPNVFNKTKCQNCFRTKDAHSAEALENNRASRNISKCGYLFVAPDWDFNVSVNRTKRWQRRWFVLYDDGELTYSLDEFPDTIPQGTIDMNKVLDVSDAESVTGNDFAISITTPEKVHFVKGTSKEESKWWFDVFQKVLPRHLARGKHKRNATFPCGKATIPPAGVITQDYCSEDDIRLNNYSRPKFLSSSDIMRNEKDWIESVEAEDEDVFPANNDDSDGESKRDVEVQNALNKLMSQSEELTDEAEDQINQEDIKVPKDGLSQLEELDARRRNRRYLKRENRVQRNQRSRNDGVSKMIPAKKGAEKNSASEVSETTSNTNGSAMAAAEKLEYLESIHSNDMGPSPLRRSTSANEKENSNEISDSKSKVNCSGKTALRKSESLKNIPSQTHSEMRDHVSGLRRYHSFKGSSSCHRKIKQSASSSAIKKVKLPSTPNTRAPSTPNETAMVPSDEKTNSEAPNLASDNSQVISDEGVFTRTGWLMRQTFNKDWSKHWFVLRDSSLTYYRDPSAEHCGIMDGILDLNQVSTIKEIESDRYYAFCLQTWDGKKHVLATETDDFRKIWIQALNYASNLWSSASKEDFICSEIVLPEHNYHHTERISSPSSNFTLPERISSPSSLSSLSYVYGNTLLETSSTSSDDQSEYFSLVDEDEVSELSSSPRTLPPSPPINRNMMSLVKEKSRSRSSCGQKTSAPVPTDFIANDSSNHEDLNYDKDNLIINEEENYSDEISRQLINGDHSVSSTKLQDEPLDDHSRVDERIAFRLDFEDQSPDKDLNGKEMIFGTPDVSFGKSSPCGNSDTSTSNSEASSECRMCFRVKSKLAAAKDEIRKLKKELKEAHANFDNLEMFSYKLQQDMKVKEENHNAQIALMTAKIDDLTAKYTLAEKNYRQLKQKSLKSDSKERKRSSLKNKEGLTITKEYELKLCDLEKKISEIETAILKDSTANSSSDVQPNRDEIVKSPELSDASNTSTSTDQSSNITKGFFSRLQSLVSRVQSVGSVVTEKSNSSSERESPRIRLEVKDAEESSAMDEVSDDSWAVTLDKNLKSINKYLEAYPANFSECQSIFIRKMSKVLKWLKTSLGNICKQGTSLANEKNVLIQNVIDLLTSMCSETPKGIEEPKQAKTCHSLLMAFEAMRLLERVDSVDSIDSLVKFDVMECAFKVLIKTLCLVFAEYENKDISTVLDVISGIPQIRFFCPIIKKLLPQNEEDEQFSTVSERLQLLNDQRSHILNSLAEAKKTKYEYLCNTLIEVPVKDSNVNKPLTVNSLEKYITSTATDIHRVAELQLSGIRNQTSFLLKAERDKVNLWCSEVKKAIKDSSEKFMAELKDECPMVHESAISLLSLSDAKRLEITNCVSELSFFNVSYVILNSLFSESIFDETVSDASSDTVLSDEEYIDKTWKTLQFNKSNFLSSPGFFECLQCTLLNNLLSDPSQEMNWVEYIHKYNFYNPRKSEMLNFQAENMRTVLSGSCSNCDSHFSSSSGRNLKDACNNSITCTECEKWIKKFCTSEKQHELEKQALESKYTRELQQLEECLTKSNKVHEQEMLQKENELESTTVQLQRLKNEYEEQIQTLKDLYEQKLHFETDQVNEDSIREAYKVEIEDLKEMFKKGLVAIENSHYRITSEMEKKHKDELSMLQAEKEKALELEAQATITALEAIKRSHEQQLKEETEQMREELLKKLQHGDHESFYCKYRNDLENLKAEILEITEKYSAKCLENISLEEKVNSLRHQLEEAHNELCSLLTKNKEIDADLSNI
ncbi:protein outspread-like isoform X1 [Argiope bruennichi]|uniref:protein outspread-like isoform X1 n=1 Tax=Argiope bruennichi TaxID=94029 RepID=UPI0024941B61|nr:protein outspread-like isoform X1 [Argiope bruennichi]